MAARVQPPTSAPDHAEADHHEVAPAEAAHTWSPVRAGPPPAPERPEAGAPAADHRQAARPPRRSWLTWRRLPVLLELATLGVAYMAPSLVRIVLTTTRGVAFGHAEALYQTERSLGINVEPWFNQLVAPHAVAALAVGY